MQTGAASSPDDCSYVGCSISPSRVQGHRQDCGCGRGCPVLLVNVGELAGDDLQQWVQWGVCSVNIQPSVWHCQQQGGATRWPGLTSSPPFTRACSVVVLPCVTALHQRPHSHQCRPLYCWPMGTPPCKHQQRTRQQTTATATAAASRQHVSWRYLNVRSAQLVAAPSKAKSLPTSSVPASLLQLSCPAGCATATQWLPRSCKQRSNTAWHTHLLHCVRG